MSHDLQITQFIIHRVIRTVSKRVGAYSAIDIDASKKYQDGLIFFLDIYFLFFEVRFDTK